MRHRTLYAVAAVTALLVAGCARSVVDGDASAGTTIAADTVTSAETEPTAEPETSTPETSAESVVSTSEQSPEPPAPPAETAERYIYYLVDTNNDWRLARELHDIPEGPDGPTAAVEAMIAGPSDPDYFSPWNPDTRVLGVDIADDLITVDLSADARTANAGSGVAATMVHQLVWTVTEAAGRPDVPVMLTIDGADAGELWGVLEWDEPMARGPDTAIRMLVQIDTPREGEAVTSPVTVTGDAAAFEATVPWRVLDADGAEVASGFTMTEDGTRFSPFSFDVELDPGAYTIEIIQDDPSDGEAGPPSVDTRNITVTA